MAAKPKLLPTDDVETLKLHHLDFEALDVAVREYRKLAQSKRGTSKEVLRRKHELAHAIANTCSSVWGRYVLPNDRKDHEQV
jgi:hypothetical protein